LNAFAERWVRSVKSECLSHFILFGEGSLRRALKNFCEHYHQERNHQGKGNLLLFPTSTPSEMSRHCAIRCRERLGGLLKYYGPHEYFYRKGITRIVNVLEEEFRAKPQGRQEHQ
jgi:hypothetical protein